MTGNGDAKTAAKAKKKKKAKSGKSGSSKKAPAAKKMIKDAPVEQYFILCNGQPVKNIKELADVLEDLRDDVFYHHVTADRNDFATWIHDVFKDVQLAEDLAGVKDKNHMRLVLYKHVIKKLS